MNTVSIDISINKRNFFICFPLLRVIRIQDSIFFVKTQYAHRDKKEVLAICIKRKELFYAGITI